MADWLFEHMLYMLFVNFLRSIRVIYSYCATNNTWFDEKYRDEYPFTKNAAVQEGVCPT